MFYSIHRRKPVWVVTRRPSSNCAPKKYPLKYFF